MAREAPRRTSEARDCEELLTYLTTRYELECAAGELAATGWMLEVVYSFYVGLVNYVFRRVTLLVFPAERRYLDHQQADWRQYVDARGEL